MEDGLEEGSIPHDEEEDEDAEEALPSRGLPLAASDHDEDDDEDEDWAVDVGVEGVELVETAGGRQALGVGDGELEGEREVDPLGPVDLDEDRQLGGLEEGQQQRKE